MRVNESATDRIVRVIVGIVLLAAAVFGWIVGGWGVVLGVVGAVLVLTGAIGFCPLYALFGASTAPRKRA